jgi:hypothetical protein
MITRDYMKVIDIVSKAFDADKDVKLTASHDTIDIFDIKTTRHDGEIISYRLLLRKDELELVLAKPLFVDMKFDKFISRFEYEMEQAFLTNIHLETSDDSRDYHVKITD